MKDRRYSACALIVGLAVACTDGPVGAPTGESSLTAAEALSASRGNDGRDGGQHIAMLDDCDPADAGWAPTGGCTLRRGNTTAAEFDALLVSPRSSAVVGHPAWRNQPSYLKVREGDRVKVTNRGGRLHTLTPVAQFGGGRIPFPPLNAGLTAAPECALAPGAADPFAAPPGQSFRLPAFAVGIQRLQCCIHPWMRQLIRVVPRGGRGHDHED